MFSLGLLNYEVKQIWLSVLTALSPAYVSAGTNPVDCCVSPDGLHLYATNNASGLGTTVSQFSINQSTGALTALSPATVTTSAGASGIAVSPDGENVYVGGADSSSIFTRNASTGLLTAAGTVAVRGNIVKVSPDGLFVYFTSTLGAINYYTRNVDTGALTSLTTIVTPVQTCGLTISEDGLFAYVSLTATARVYMYARNISTGLLTALTPAYIASSGGSQFISISRNGRSVYVAGGDAVSQYSRDAATGLLTALSPASVAAGSGAIASLVSLDDQSVYVTNYTAASISIYSRNTLSGALTAVDSVAGGNYGLTISPSGSFVYSAEYTQNRINQYLRT